MPRHPILLLALTIAVGITLRRVPLGLPQVVTKYAGYMLWAVMIYLLTTLAASKILPHLRRSRAALTAAAITTVVELFKLIHTPTLDAFRLTLPGTLLLGRIFSPWDLIAYYAAIALAAKFLPRSVTNPA